MPTASSSGTRRIALAVGSEVPAGNFAFRVHSVFGTALNLVPDGRRCLVTLLGAGADDLPQGIRLGSRERFDSWPTPVGTRGRREGGMLVFGNVPGEDLLVVDLPAGAVATRRPLPHMDPAGEDAREAWAVCAFHLDGLQEEKEADLRLATLCGMSAAPTTAGGRLADAAGDLGGAIRAGNVRLAGDAAARMVGLGTGLTPSGDDFLCGLLAALWCTSAEGTAERGFAREWGAQLAGSLDSTTAISATFLECAIAGCFPGTVTALAAAFAGRDTGHAHEEPRRALDALCAVGHSSGLDTATGFLFGLWLRTGDETRRYAPPL